MTRDRFVVFALVAQAQSIVQVSAANRISSLKPMRRRRITRATGNVLLGNPEHAGVYYDLLLMLGIELIFVCSIQCPG